MIFVFLTFNLLLYLVSILVYKKRFNPVSIYSLIWVIMLVTYELKLIKYYDLSTITWIVIFSFQIAYSLGCYLGGIPFRFMKCQDFKKFHSSSNKNLDIISVKMAKLKNIILILSIISALAIIPNFINLIKTYGTNVLALTAKIYHDRLAGSQGFEMIPYLGALSHLAVILSGIYIRRFGLKLFLVIPFLLLILNSLPSGGRSDLSLGLLYLIFPILISPTKIRFNKKQKFGIGIILTLLIFVFLTITSNKSGWHVVTEDMSPMMVTLVEYNPSIYKIYLYVSSPIGVLNSFLVNPSYSFGINSFGFIISILNKFGAELSYERYQAFYQIPVSVNVGTYIREIIQDFSYLGILIILAYGFLFGKLYYSFTINQSFFSEIMVIVLSVIIFMSFFVWFFRETFFWITIFFTPFITIYLDKRVPD
jgi:hypothetical protein